MSAVSEQYAVALFELALELDALKTTRQAFDKFIESYDASTRTFFLHPNITKPSKRELIDSLKVPTLFGDFVKVVIDYNRMDRMGKIHESFIKLMEELDDVMRIRVHTGKPLSKERVNELEQVYSEKYHRNVIVEAVVDETIVGGMKVEYNGMVLNDTVNYSLNKLKSRLTQ